MQPAETCEGCQRPRHSDDDLERWRREVNEVTRMGGDPLKHNPEWARALCWTRRELKCVCTPAGIGAGGESLRAD